MSNQIALPQFLIQRGSFFKKINENNSKVFSQVEYLRQLVTSMHQMYNQLCKKMMQTSEHFQRKILHTCKVKTEHSEVVMDFVKAISFLHFSISNQLNTNSVALGTKTHRIAQNRLQILNQRMIDCYHINQDYVRRVQKFNEQEEQFTKRSEYYSDYEKDVIKYFSLKDNVEENQKLQLMEIRLKQSQEETLRMKQDYQQNVHECRTLIKDYFQLQRSIISEYCRLLLTIRRKSNSTRDRMFAEPIIEQPSNQMNTSTIKGEMGPITNRSERPHEKSMASLRRQIIREEDRVKSLQNILDHFLQQVQEAIKAAGQKIDQIRDESDYDRFYNSKIAMSEVLPADSIREIDLIVNQVSLFRTVILNLQSQFGKFKVLKENSKYRIYNYQKFINDSEVYIEMQKKNSLGLTTRDDYFRLQKKFLARNIDLLSNYRDRVLELQQIILSEYYRQETAYSQHKNRRVVQNDIFVKVYYQNLMESFFLNRSGSMSYQQNLHLKKLSTNMSANQMQNAMTLEGYNKKKKGKSNCCGFFQTEEEEIETQSMLDDFHCSLKNGFLLIRGKLKIYENYFSFTSSFNPRTFIGLSDIRVPRWNIKQIGSGKHLLAQKIVIETTHGDLQFTDFFNSPYNLLVQTYETKKSGVSTFKKKGEGETQMVMLEQKFQSQFQGELLKVQIYVDKLSTYLSQDRQKLSVSIEYHPNGSSTHALFEIKIIQKDIVIEYVFIHDQKFKNNDAKSSLEEVAKQLINRKQEPGLSLKKIGRMSQLECSIIECKEDNKISFVKEPSFMNIKGNSIIGDINVDDMKASQHSFGQFLNSKNLLQTSRNNQPDSKITPPLSSILRRNTINDEGTTSSNLILQTGRISGQGTKSEEMRLNSQRLQKQFHPIQQINQSKRSRISKKSKKMTCKQSPNYALAIYIILIVFGLNCLLKVII